MGLVKGWTLIVLVFFTLVTFGREKQNKVLQEQPKSTEDRLKPGQACIDFSFADISGKALSLKKLRGKYVYIDVWATWCKPCIAEIPFLQGLEKEMKGKKIVFLSLSCDRDKKKWEDFVREKKPGGLQVFMGEKGDEFMNFFRIEGIPHFILLDKKGNIVNANMGQPSFADTRARLMMLKDL